MPIILLPTVLPDVVSKALADGLTQFSRTADPNAQDLLKSAGQPFEVYYMGIDGVLAGPSGLPKQPSGYRVAVFVDQTAYAADIYTVPRGPLPPGTSRLACVRKGPSVGALLKEVADVARQPDDGPFTPRLLTLPGLYTDALWLVPPSLDLIQSRLIPYHTLVRTLNPGTLYSPDDFLARLYPVADYWRFRPRPENKKPRYRQVVVGQGDS
jgi:hypothetical protein